VQIFQKKANKCGSFCKFWFRQLLYLPLGIQNMSIPTPEIRLAILFAAAFAIALFLAVIIIMHSLGNMENYLKRMQFIISKEIILRYNQQVNYYKQQRQRFLAQQERDKRQEALLEIPLVRNSEHNLKEKL